MQISIIYVQPNSTISIYLFCIKAVDNSTRERNGANRALNQTMLPHNSLECFCKINIQNKCYVLCLLLPVKKITTSAIGWGWGKTGELHLLVLIGRLIRISTGFGFPQSE